MPYARVMCVLLLAGSRPLFAQTGTSNPGPVQINESVDVHAADAPAVDIPGLRSTVPGPDAAALPLNGRSFIPLIALFPGVALPQGSALPRINGGRPRTNEYIFDGISVLQPEPGQVPFLPVIDAIDSLTIARNSPPAEFGRFNGGVVTIVTRAGGDSVHGAIFDFGRHEALNARNLFAQPDTAADSGKPRFRRQQFGGTAGGPLRTGRLFFFADYQGTAQTIGRVAISTVPTLLQRQGIFSEAVGGRVTPVYDPDTLTRLAGGAFTRAAFPGNVIPASRIDPAAVALLQRYPHPTSDGTANNYRRVADEHDAQRQIGGRVDYRASDRTRAFARLSVFRDEFNPVSPLPDGSGTVTSGATGPQRTGALAIASNYQRTLGSRSFNELRMGYTRRTVGRRGLDIATYMIDGYQQLGSPPNTMSDFRTDVTQMIDALTWVHGRNNWKAGFDARWQRLDGVQPPSPNGAYRFSSLFTDLPGTSGTGSPFASFLLGQVQSFSIDVQRNAIRPRAHSAELFLQDSWKPTDRLTLDAGVRYTLNFPSTEADDQAAVFNLETERLEFLGRDGHPRTARELHKLNFGPRLGIIWRAANRTVLSAGYALVWIEQTGITTPFTTPQFPFLQTLTQRTLDSVTPAAILRAGPTITPIPLTPDAGLGQGVFAVDRSLGSGSAQQWHVAVRRQLGSRLSAELAYAGSTIAHVGIPDSNVNQLSVDELALGSALLQRVANPFYGRIPRSSSIGDPTIPIAQLLKPYPRFTTVSLYRHNVGTTEYRAGEVTLEHRLAHGLSARVSYTRSRLVDDASSVFDASILTGPVANFPVADSFNRSLERDLSNGDMPHVLSASASWTIGGWTLSPIVTMQSGVPLAVTQATNFNAFAGFGTQRPNRTHDPSLPVDRRSVAEWFDTTAFTVAPQFTIGTSSRNPVRGPGYHSIDVAIARRISLRARSTMELRGELFNIANTPPLGAPNTVLGTPGFGSITSAGDPRVGQLAIKLLF
jgi:hypothetical protein